MIVAGLCTFLMAPFFARLLRFFPPMVTGSVILIIGIALLPVAADDIVDGRTTLALDPVLLENVAYAMGTLLLIVVIQRDFRGFLGTVAVPSGLVVGTSVAWVLGDARFADVGSAAWGGFTVPFSFWIPTFSITAIMSMVVVMLITAVETTGDVYATGEIVGKWIKRADIAAALRADGLATTIGGVGDSFPYTCFAENVGLVRLTQVRSRWVIVVAIPHPVLGGAALAMFAAVAVVGIQPLGKVDFSDHRDIIVVGTSVGSATVVTAQP